MPGVSRRSARFWWTLAFLVSAGGASYILFTPTEAFLTFTPGECPGWEIFIRMQPYVMRTVGWLPMLWYAGLPGVVLGFLASWIAGRYGRPRWGRVACRILALLLLAVHGAMLAVVTVDLLADRGCAELWGGALGVRPILLSTVAPVLAAGCMLAAVRPGRPEPRGRSRQVRAG